MAKKNESSAPVPAPAAAAAEIVGAEGQLAAPADLPPEQTPEPQHEVVLIDLLHPPGAKEHRFKVGEVVRCKVIGIEAADEKLPPAQQRIRTVAHLATVTERDRRAR